VTAGLAAGDPLHPVDAHQDGQVPCGVDGDRAVGPLDEGDLLPA
jgi:hypothetical protein